MTKAAICPHPLAGVPYDPAATCHRRCWLYHNDAAYRAYFDGTALPPDAGSSSPLTACAFRGDDLAHAEREALGVGHQKRWALCLNPDHGEYRKPVCPCTGCGTKCPSYVASKVEAD